jgi:hypothetical protein
MTASPKTLLRSEAARETLERGFACVATFITIAKIAAGGTRCTGHHHHSEDDRDGWSIDGRAAASTLEETPWTHEATGNMLCKHNHMNFGRNYHMMSEFLDFAFVTA